MRTTLIAAALIALLVEGLFVASYLPTVQEGVEADGALFLVLGTIVMFVALWLQTTQWRHRRFGTGLLLFCSGVALLLAYFLMIRW